MLNAWSHSSNARIKKNNAEAQSKHVTTIFSLDEFETMQKRKGNGISKDEAFHAVASGRNRGRGKKVVNFSII
jgi:hypothetical protein